MRIVFFGTPDFAKIILESLISQNLDVVLVVTQPDKKVARAQKLVFSPVKETATKYGIEAFQPVKVSSDFEKIIEAKPDLIITAAYGQILPQVILDVPTYKAINIHASLLPRWRGGAPIHYAVMSGDVVSGISIIEMVSIMDAGPVIAMESVSIDQNETTSGLYVTLADLACKMILQVIRQFENNQVSFTAQNESEVTFAPNLTREDEQIDWNKSSQEIHNKIRGLFAWPIASGIVNQKQYKFHEARLTSVDFVGLPGYMKVIDGKLYVKTGDGAIEILKIQPVSKKVQLASDFVNGFRG